MKKLISAAVLALTFCAATAPSAFAFGRCFGLCPHHGCCGCRCCCCTICCRQYNAFTPCCCGSICCNGCCPIGCGGGGCGGGGCGGGYCGDMGGPCMGGSCGPMGCGGPMAYSGLPDGGAPSVGPVSQTVTDPCAPATSVAASSLPQSPIQTTTYRPYTRPYPPAAAPAAGGYYRPQSAAAPSYWYDN
jgi:hypothetical protein